MGDFNDILAKEERVGHRVRSYPDSDFLTCVNYCKLEDVKSSGNFFTWTNKQPAADRIYSKIDRIMANQAWIEKYEFVEAVFLNEGLFDHSPAILSLHPHVVVGKKPFKYFRMWKSHTKYDSMLRDVWKLKISGNQMYQAVCKLKLFKERWRKLNKEVYSDLQQQVHEAKATLDRLQNQLEQQPLEDSLHQQERLAR
uniref:Endonuclease/exonuclease/phosphatase domain-containing protein n=1 Tax=Cannabis sativa TaxID=3483 RepID=A0A803P5E1_CANSA